MFELVRMESNTIKKNEIVHFIDELLRQQWLIPRVAPSLIGEDYFKKLIDHVNRIAPTHALNKRLKDIHISLNQIDQSKRTIMANYETIVDQIYKLPLKEKYPYYFQTDCFYHFEHNTLNYKLEADQKLSHIDLDLSENSIVVSPTGSGKSYYIGNKLTMKRVMVVPT